MSLLSNTVQLLFTDSILPLLHTLAFLRFRLLATVPLSTVSFPVMKFLVLINLINMWPYYCLQSGKGRLFIVSNSSCSHIANTVRSCTESSKFDLYKPSRTISV